MPFDGIVTRAVTNELQEKIILGKINKIYQPTETEIIVTIRSQGHNHTLLLSIHPMYARVHLTNDVYRNPKEPPMFCMLLRKHLSGATIETIEQKGMERIITFTIKTRNELGDTVYKELILELMGKHSNLMLVDQEKEMILDSLKHVSSTQNRHRTILPGKPYKLPPVQDKLNMLQIEPETFIRKLDFNAGHLTKQIVNTLVGLSPLVAKEMVHRANLGSEKTYMEKFTEMKEIVQHHHYKPTIYYHQKEDFHVIPLTFLDSEHKEFSTTNRMLDKFYSGKAERDRVKQRAKDLYRFIKNEKDKNERKLKKHQKTLKKAENAKKYQRKGELLTANMHQVKLGDSTVQVIDYYDPEQKETTIDLDPTKTPSENAQSFFKTYQKLKTSKQMVEKEMEKTKEEIIYLEQLLQQIDVAGEDDIEEIRDELREEGYLKKQSKQKKNKNKPSIPKPEEFISSDGTLLLVGKNNKQNDYLTTKLARRNEIWLHTKDIPGSHVVIRSTNPSEETILEAAQLAAFFSKSQQSSSVPVDYTTIKHVKKPNGAKPGYVTYDNQKTLFVTPQKEIVEKLKK
ncbi:Rqc2 family fibronectin-binding protein [Oceanobacillus halotolerans]|uniref:Rqc2 family fibronectin-binding protein n=1 Tax=Oceanobacillus halotolerans TaxID=2663380 RepID=UPI0013D91465|nr:NFACT RNA binding domain-containing protein [Oceanobacillus halotolerans]